MQLVACSLCSVMEQVPVVRKVLMRNNLVSSVSLLSIAPLDGKKRDSGNEAGSKREQFRLFK